MDRYRFSYLLGRILATKQEITIEELKKILEEIDSRKFTPFTIKRMCNPLIRRKLIVMDGSKIQNSTNNTKAPNNIEKKSLSKRMVSALKRTPILVFSFILGTITVNLLPLIYTKDFGVIVYNLILSFVMVFLILGFHLIISSIRKTVKKEEGGK